MDYTKLNEKEILEWLKKNLSEKRYIHSVGTAQCAKELAKQFNLDENKAYWAGLLHDCAKCFDKEKLLEIINENLNVNQNELMNYKTLHAPVSAHCAKNDLGICDDEILSAIRWHTLGKLEMSDFEKIIFLADKIESNTRDEKYTKRIWKLIEKNKGIIGLDLALLKCFCETIKKLVSKRYYICANTIDVYNELQQHVGELSEEENY